MVACARPLSQTMRAAIATALLLSATLLTVAHADVNGTNDADVLENRTWRRISYVGHNETLPCILIADLEAQNITVSAEDITWQLPDGRTLNVNTTELDNKKIVDSGDLLITEIKKEDFAWYLCIVINDTETLYSKALLKKVLTSDELHDQQMTQVTIGSIAAAVVIAIFGSLCIIYLIYPTETSPDTDEAGRKRSGYPKNRVDVEDTTEGEENKGYVDTEETKL